ncbi:methyltransferase domain-containing protein [Microaerobacter geothermalis]|uniref:class I SAM-dependent methyltransferase n=1 Tax=Microaerobacter geothermalis TaxID=674972 RepID=UPI001F478610|nr:methyltransferase domain-containing protein [Microaerobacter geothermalis]MCF6094157.1 methyltransferase domain-containing protein [Microaerobacter geothermalis]
MNHEEVKLTETIKGRYNRIAPIFDVMDRMIKEEWRKDVFSLVKGRVLEVGVGTGANLPFYPADTEVTGIDFSPNMLKYARRKLEKGEGIKAKVQLLEMDAQQMNFPDNTFDTVVTTCVYCSVPDPVKGLKEIRRVCKPDGQVIMLEHMRSENPVLGTLMDWLNPIPVTFYGANINRRTVENIEKAGMKVVRQKFLMMDIMRLMEISPNK